MFEFTLGNGVRVVLIDIEHTQTVSVGVFVNTGSANETPAENGISHFLEHMAFKGTKKRSYNRISSDAERLGAEMNAFTDRDMTAYFIKGLAEHAPVFVDILSDIFCNSVFDPAEIEKEREVILQEYRMYADKPMYVAHDLTYAVAYPNQAFGRKIIGEPKNIKSFQREDFLAYVDKHYRGSNVIVGIAGKFNRDDVLNAVRAFEKVKPSVVSRGLGVQYVPSFESGFAVKKKTVEQCAVAMTFEGVSEDDPMYYAYEVAIAAIGDGMSSPLFDEVREKRGLVYSVSAHTDSQHSSGVVTVTAGTTADKIDELLKTAQEVFMDTALKIKPIDMERAKNMLSVQLATSTEKPFNLLLNTVSEAFNGKVFNVEDEIAKIRAVTPAQAKKAIKKILSSKKVVVAVGNKIDPAVVEKYSKTNTYKLF